MPNEYLCSTLTAGFKIYIHNSTVFPFMKNLGLNVPLGHTTSIMLFQVLQNIIYYRIQSVSFLGRVYFACCSLWRLPKRSKFQLFLLGKFYNWCTFLNVRMILHFLSQYHCRDVTEVVTQFKLQKSVVAQIQGMLYHRAPNIATFQKVL